VFHGIASAVQLIGLGVIVFGVLRVLRAPALAARRTSASAPPPEGNRERAAPGLVGSYRIWGAVAIAAGTVLLLVPVFAG
jgi:hypothetical protein